MVTEAWLLQRGLLCPAHSCCPATLAKAVSLYLLPLLSIIQLPLLFYCFITPSSVQHCSELLLCVSSVDVTPDLSLYHNLCYLCHCFLPFLSACFPPLPPFASHWFTLLLSLTQTQQPLLTQTQIHTLTRRLRWCTAAVCVHCLCDGLDDPLLNYSVTATPSKRKLK